MKRKGTVCFLIQDKKVLLAKIDYGSGVVKWNGVGGFVEEGETPTDAVTREALEEIGIIIDRTSLKEETVVNVSPELELHVFTATQWDKEPVIKDTSIKELKWFLFNNIPYNEMWEGNDAWFPKILDTIKI